MDYLFIYTVWLMALSATFSLLPIVLISDWKRRGSSDGFSSVSLVLPLLSSWCWFEFGILADDFVQLYLSLYNLTIYFFYISVFAYYQSKRHYILLQLFVLFLAISLIFVIVRNKPEKQQVNAIGSLAAITQVFGLIGPIYDIKRAICLNTTEYIPILIQFGVFLLTVQWILYGILANNCYITYSSSAGEQLLVGRLQTSPPTVSSSLIAHKRS